MGAPIPSDRFCINQKDLEKCRQTVQSDSLSPEDKEKVVTFIRDLENKLAFYQTVIKTDKLIIQKAESKAYRCVNAALITAVLLVVSVVCNLVQMYDQGQVCATVEAPRTIHDEIVSFVNNSFLALVANPFLVSNVTGSK